MQYCILEVVMSWKQSYPQHRIPNRRPERKAAILELLKCFKNQMALEKEDLDSDFKQIIIDACVAKSMKAEHKLRLWRSDVAEDLEMAALELWPNNLFPKKEEDNETGNVSV